MNHSHVTFTFFVYCCLVSFGRFTWVRFLVFGKCLNSSHSVQQQRSAVLKSKKKKIMIIKTSNRVTIDNTPGLIQNLARRIKG